MKSHVFGFAIFSIIVAGAVTVNYLLFFEKSKPVELGHIRREKPSNYGTRETFNDGYANVRVQQAILDLKTGELKTHLTFGKRWRTNKNFVVALHFFVKNGNRTVYLSTEQIAINPAFDSEKEFFLSLPARFDNQPSLDNLYVIPEDNDTWTNYQENQPVFDYKIASPVLLAKDKNF